MGRKPRASKLDASKPGQDGSNRANRLLTILERIERLEEEKRELAASIVTVKQEAKAAGFDLRVVSQMLRERRMSREERAEWQALCETYRAALGMLDGTPLSDSARRRFTGETASPSIGPGEPPADGGVREPPGIGSDDIAAARIAGAVAFTAKMKITDNPYPFHDPRRAAWDEGWCKEAGSDGMDLPEVWRRSKPPKSDGKSDGKGAP